MIYSDFLPLADGILDGLRQWDSAWKIHPILVNFTAALVPVSIGSDIAGRLLHRESLRNVGWWTSASRRCKSPCPTLAGPACGRPSPS
jgi:hypothetical protein